MVHKQCSYFDCENDRQKQPYMNFFRFPKDKRQCDLWVKRCGNSELSSLQYEELQSCVVCEEHFEQESFKNTMCNILLPNAAPVQYKVDSGPRKKMETRNHSKRAASKEAMKQMQLLSSAYNDDEEMLQTLEIPSDDDINIEMPPKKKYKIGPRKSSLDGTGKTIVDNSFKIPLGVEKEVVDRDVIVVKKSCRNGENTLKLEAWAEELSPAQQAMHLKHAQELQEMNARIEQFVKQSGAEIIYQGETCSAYQVATSNASNITISNLTQQQNIVLQPTKGNNATNSYQLVVDPRIGFIVGTMTPTTAPSLTAISQPPVQKQQQPQQQQKQQQQQPSTPTNTQARPLRKRKRNTIVPSVSLTSITPTTTVQPVIKPKPKPPVTTNVVQKIVPGETSLIGGISGTPQRTIAPTNSVVDLTTDDNRPSSDSREVSFNKLQGKTFPSLVVVARPHLRVKDVTGGDRSKLDAKVKAVLMHPPTKFTEWLIQQGLVRSEQTCRIHPTSKLKLGMYSDASKFPYSGGYVWISDCCPQRFVSVFSGSIFEGSPHPPSVILKLIYHWSCQTNVQNVVQWVKVDNLYVKGLNTWLRAICTVALHTNIRPLGGSMRKVEVGVISLGTTSQDGHQRQVKVEVLGLLESDNKLLRLRAVEPLSDGDRNYRKRFSKILEPIANWVHPDSIIVTDLTVDKGTLHSMGFKHIIQSSSNDIGPNNNTIMEYLRRIVPRMFQNTLSLLSRQIIQQFLDELVWREWYGTTAGQAFDNIILHLSEQTRADTGQSLIMRLNKVASNPFKTWRIGQWGIPTSSFNKGELPVPKRVYGRQQRKISPKAPSPVPEVVRPPKAISPDIPQQMVPLENYYYGTIEGQIKTDNKIVLKLKCSLCKSTFSNNITLMTHLFYHAHNVPGSMAQQCRYCLASVTSAEGLLKHISSSHPEATRFSDGFACLICESHFQNPYSLGKHMSTEHSPSELPYQCGVCGYQCSSHKQAIDHFYASHSGCGYIQCPFCLKSLMVASNGRMLPQNIHFFLQHLQKHQKKALAKKCSKCALWFIQKEALKDHQIKMHASQRHKPGLVPWNVPRNNIMVPKSKQDYRPIEEDRFDLSGLRVVTTETKLLCKECKFLITSYGHYPALESCPNNNCQYSTCCKYALKQHDKVCRALNTSLPLQELPFEMFCVCGFSSIDGNILAKHLAECERKSAYPSLEAAQKAIVTHSMLDVLGLVRRPEEPQNSTVEIVDLDNDNEDDKVSEDSKNPSTDKFSVNKYNDSNETKENIKNSNRVFAKFDNDEATVILDDDSSEEKSPEKDEIDENCKKGQKQISDKAESDKNETDVNSEENVLLQSKDSECASDKDADGNGEVVEPSNSDVNKIALVPEVVLEQTEDSQNVTSSSKPEEIDKTLPQETTETNKEPTEVTDKEDKDKESDEMAGVE